ncbi:MAG: hypothetical protein Q9162_001419 [Coniocarpon cinnabarinum]
MKFGSNLPRLQVPEWSSDYIDYKTLKKLIKSASVEQRHGQEPDLAGFFYSLDRNLETVDNFYNKKYAEVERRVKLLRDRYDDADAIRQVTGKEEIEDAVGIVLELRGQLRKLQWFGEVNRRGFVKILKKKDKKLPTPPAQERYLLARVDPRPFATNILVIDDLNTIGSLLVSLGELTPSDYGSDVSSSGLLSRTSTKSGLHLPRELLEELQSAINQDDANTLSHIMLESKEASILEQPSSQKLLHQLLQRCISCNSQSCITVLLSRLPTLDEDDDISRRNCLHRLVLATARAAPFYSSLGWKPASSDDGEHAIGNCQTAEILSDQRSTLEMKQSVESSLEAGTSKSSELLQCLLHNLMVTQRAALNARDAYGRMPLHYAAQHGLTKFCKILIDYMKAWSLYDASAYLDSDGWQDEEGHSPVHLSVREGHVGTTKYLLDASQECCNADPLRQKPLRLIGRPHALLTIAAKADHSSIISLLVEAGANVNLQDSGGETPLHTAARFGHLDSAKALVAESKWERADIDIPENTFGWTPITTASVEGHLGVVEALAHVGANVHVSDVSGWTAAEHAALRGHLDVARFLMQCLPGPSPPSQDVRDGKKASSPALNSRSSTLSSRERSSSSSTEPIKSFGHRYLKEESLILVSLGSMDPRKKCEPVHLDNIPPLNAHTSQLDTALSVVVSAIGAKSSESTLIDLPVNENISTDPIVFTAKDVKDVKLLFDLVPTYSGPSDAMVGRGVAMLSSIKANLGSRRMNLQGDVSVPIMAAKTMEYIGLVNFNFLVITPFAHPNMSVSADQTYWKSMAGPMVIGHRGMGKNMASRKSLQLGENTLQSFVTASSLGASYVEFDVQLTKDHVPIIYHDFLVSETGIDAPVHTLTLEQFLHVNETITPHGSRAASPDSVTVDGASSAHSHVRPKPKERSRSMGATDGKPTTNMSERMKHTRDFKMKGFKGNSRGNFIQEPFTTLEEMFRKLPEHIGFNIEMKYPMLFESEEQEMDTYAVELNSFVDTVLKMVYDLGSQRNIIFSSFNPDICLLLSFKQPSIPVLFLTDAGASTVGDVRASSLQEAIRFASRWNLLGIVSAAEPLVTCPRLVRVVKESGLVCVSYGTLNNEPENVKRQVDEGIDAVIVDSVLAIRQGLTGDVEART